MDIVSFKHRNITANEHGNFVNFEHENTVKKIKFSFKHENLDTGHSHVKSKTWKVKRKKPWCTSHILASAHMPNTSASLESRDWSACRIENITHYNSFPFSLPLCSCILFSLLTVCRLSDDGNVILMIIDIERRRCWSGKLKCDAEIEES